jgi:hypothetical protein
VAVIVAPWDGMDQTHAARQRQEVVRCSWDGTSEIPGHALVSRIVSCSVVTATNKRKKNEKQ